MTTTLEITKARLDSLIALGGWIHDERDVFRSLAVQLQDSAAKAKGTETFQVKNLINLAMGLTIGLMSILEQNGHTEAMENMSHRDRIEKLEAYLKETE